ncbi:MAG: iron chaperone [Acidimicrobiia bacterium]
MSAADIDAYLAGLDEPKRTTLEALRRAILAVVPDAEQTLAYGVPAFRVRGKLVAGFAAFARHLSYLPHSGTVLSATGEVTAAYRTSKGALQFPVDAPLPDDLVAALLRARLRELEPGASS